MTTQITSTPASNYPNRVVAQGDNLMNASMNWRNRPADERFQTLEAMHAQAEAERRRSHTQSKILPRQITVVASKDQKGIQLQGLSDAVPTHWSFSQLSKLAGAPAAYLRKLPTENVISDLNWGLKNAPEQPESKLMIRDVDDDGSLTELAAITSETYGRIWNVDVTGALSNLLPKLPVRYYNPHALNVHTGKTEPSGLFLGKSNMFAFYVTGGDESSRRAGAHSIDDGKSEINRGFFVWNSEVGDKSFGIATFMFRYTCQNLIVWGASDLKQLVIRHSSGAPARFEDQALPQLTDFAMSNMDAEAAAIKAAQKFALAKEADDRLDFFKKLGFTGAEVKRAQEAAEREEGRFETLWDAVNGFTASARSLAWIDARVDLERRAGKLLDLAIKAN